MKGIIGITRLNIQHEMNSATEINLQLVAYPGYDANHLWNEKWMEMFPGNVVVKCSHCGQWGAIKCDCKYCGAPVT